MRLFLFGPFTQTLRIGPRSAIFQHHVDGENYRDDGYDTPKVMRCIKICMEFLGNIDKRSILLVEKEAARGKFDPCLGAVGGRRTCRF